MVNPYWGKDFFEFFAVLFSRLFSWIGGENLTLASDEVQLLVLMGIAIASSAIGCFLILKRMTMLANSLSHTILLGIVLAYLFTFSSVSPAHFINLKVLLIGALIASILTTLLTQLLKQVMKLQEDASIGLVFSTLFALGVVLVTLYTRSAHISSEAIMGNVDALHPDDLKLTAFVCLLDLVPILLLFKGYKATSFDPGFAKSSGFSPTLFNYILMLQVAATAIGAFRAVGVLLFLALLVGPPLTARMMTNNLGRLIFYSMGIGAFCSVIAVALSRHVLTVFQAPLSTAGIVVVTIAFVFACTLALKKLWKNNPKHVNVN